MFGEIVLCFSPRRISILASEELAARDGNREKQSAAEPASVDCRNSRRVFKEASCVTGDCVTVAERLVRQNTYCQAIGVVAASLWRNHSSVMDDKADVWQGTLALMILKTLQAMGALHGYGIARRIE